MDIDACIMAIPGQDEPSGPGMLIGLPSLLDSGLLAAVILGASTPVRVVADSNLEGRTQWKIGRTWAETILDCALRLRRRPRSGCPRSVEPMQSRRLSGRS
jgi:hypothetical protein